MLQWKDFIICSKITTNSVTRTYIERNEGGIYYKLVSTDTLVNISSHTSVTIYLDYSNSKIWGIENMITDWTDVAHIINISTTDYLHGTNYNGSIQILIEVVINRKLGFKNNGDLFFYKIL